MRCWRGRILVCTAESVVSVLDVVGGVVVMVGSGCVSVDSGSGVIVTVVKPGSSLDILTGVESRFARVFAA